MNVRHIWTQFLEQRLGGHISFYLFGHRVTVYGFNAMHVAVNIATDKWGYVCFHPPIRFHGQRWPWYFYLSPNATPGASTLLIGPAHTRIEKWEAWGRFLKFGHNFPASRYRHEDHHFDQYLVKPPMRDYCDVCQDLVLGGVHELERDGQRYQVCGNCWSDYSSPNTH